MTDYNDGKWHGWNGGKCPVHPMSVVEILEPVVGRFEGPASNIHWKHLKGAFRVIKQHREPREVWMSRGYSDGFWIQCKQHEYGAILFREVLE